MPHHDTDLTAYWQVPTMAIECCFFSNNTSVIPDELLAHRLGLVPLNADPRYFDYKSADVEASSQNTLVFKLQAKGIKPAQSQPDKFHCTDGMVWCSIVCRSRVHAFLAAIWIVTALCCSLMMFANDHHSAVKRNQVLPSWRSG